MRRFALAALALAALGLSGCVEGEQNFTLNPDGSGKVRIDVVMAPPGFLDAFGPPGNEPDTLDGMRQKSLRAVLQSKGVAAWKEVNAGFAPDGRFKFTGTAYFDRVAELEIKGLAVERPLALTPAGSGLTFGPVSRGPGGGPVPEPDGTPFGGKKRKTAAEYARMTDAELDDVILTDRVGYQANRPMLRALLTGVRMKSTYLLPGAVKGVTGFKADGSRLVREVNGDQIIAATDKMFTKSNAEIRPLYRTAGALDALVEEFAKEFGGKLSASVPTPGPPQFDYAAEVKAARDAYPALRKALGVPDDFWIPDGNPPPVPKRPGM